MYSHKICIFATDYNRMEQILRETIKIERLTIGYKTKKYTKPVAKDINACIYSGQLTCLLGSNGVGKSTLLRTLSGFQPELEGEINLSVQTNHGKTTENAEEWRSLSSMSDKELAQTISVVLTEKPEIENMTVMEMIEMGRSPYTGFWGTLDEEDRQIVDKAIAMVGIEDLRKRKINRLSDGERQKVMIAKALAQQTPIIFLDEPTAFLDYPSKVETMLLLSNICRETGKTVLLSTHDLELALQTADIIWLMSRDKPLKIGTPEQLAADGSMKAFVERPGILFESNTLTIRINKQI